MRWAALYKWTPDRTQHWSFVPFYKEWGWYSFHSFNTKEDAEDYLGNSRRDYPNVAFCVMPTNLSYADMSKREERNV